MAVLTATDELGRDNAGRYVGLRQGKCWERTENSNYYCGGCGWKVTDHDSFCPECGGAFRECDASNLEAENAKLRELASILCFCMQIHKRCDDCKLNGAKGELVHDPLCACDSLHELLQKLGIEVDE